MRHKMWVLISFSIILTSFAFCTQLATTDSGKRVILRDDGTWSYVKSPTKNKVFTYDFRKAKWGMTKEEVKKTEESPVIYEGWNETDDAIVLYYKEKVFLFEPTITYIFKDDKLVKGHYLFELSTDEEDRCIADFDTIVDALIEKYGEPMRVSMVWSDSTYMNDKTKWGKALRLGHFERKGIWETGRTLIDLKLYCKDENIIMEINYIDKKYEPDTEL
jgi:hypothetical protein